MWHYTDVAIHFTCFTSTKVHALTAQELPVAAKLRRRQYLHFGTSNASKLSTACSPSCGETNVYFEADQRAGARERDRAHDAVSKADSKKK